uniref:VLIG-type G domain-containing protein n=1 Tax=Gasterosteus aculeatus aculeatus TaxID=481459 RepID=A0AAQ4QQJ6_GASAC|nr:interferon-induced very large GTPase 1-like isoform X6 [Gasterosteus aculeatus aculeatus]
MEELEESAAENKLDLVNERGEAQQSEKNDESTGAETVAVELSVSNKKMMPDLTANSIEIGTKNILLEEQKNAKQFSTNLYDLCGRHISVVNPIGLQNFDEFPSDQDIHAFLTLLPNGQHNSHFNSGVQWLKKSFGKGLMAYVLTVVTHESDEKCESALTDLKANSSFVEKRSHTCKYRSMDEREIIALLEQVDAMVSENGPYHSGVMCDATKGKKEHMDHKYHKEERIDPSMCQESQTEDTDENATAIKVKNDLVNGAKHECDEDIEVGGESDMKSVLSSANNKGEPDEDNKVNNDRSSNMSEPSKEESDVVKDKCPTPQRAPTGTKEGELEQSAAKEMCDPVKTPADIELNSDIKSGQSVANEKVYDSTPGPFHMDTSENMDVKSEESSDGMNTKRKHQTLLGRLHLEENLEKNDRSSNMSEPSKEESDVVKDKCPTPQRAPTGTKEGELEQSAAKEMCDPVKTPADIELNSDIKSGKSVANEKVYDSTPGPFHMDTSENMDVKSEESSDGRNTKRHYQTLLGRLHLEEKLEKKFSTATFLKLGTPVKQDVDVDEKDVAYTFLQKLWMLDYRARYIPTKEKNPELNHSTPVRENVTDDTEDDDFDYFYSPNDDFDRSNLQTHVHPMDVQMAVFHCSDSFFKQNMVTKLSQCQYALPLLVPDPVTMDIECPLWTFRQITKKWKATEMKGDSNVVTMKSMPICKAETPMVSFLRLGSPSLSKSQLMNTLINDRHNTFFHRNCPGSTESRHLMDGVAEIAWYCPAGKPNDAFTDCVAFCNLHGDALSFEKQREILTDKSSIIVVLVPTLEKNDKSSAVISALYNGAKPLICLIADSDGGAVQMKKGNYKMGLKDKTHSAVSKELKKIIGKIMSRSHSLFQLESMNKVCGIKVDEEDTVCQKGKSAAMKNVGLLQGIEVSKIKDTYLPCQGQLWKEWSKIHKELYCLKGNIEDDKVQKEQKLMEKRQEQVNVSCSEPMKMFTESLSTLSGNDNYDYFLKWTQILIDALSTDNISSILQTYDTKWAEVFALKKKPDKTELLITKQTELDKISTELQSATFGLEHLFREMGQIYEAHESLQKPKKSGPTDWSKYPELAAELMISGHPMELMDGDAGCVPLTWISSLLEEVIKKLGDKRVFVLSVLGLQSSGKSTMLNAMFGLQFAVSAGRCTKGAFMQLVEVSEEMTKDFKFDYVLVVDTEGLRALELEGIATLHHDNELATFVVGLGNMTLINIFGENPAEMQDVLQIVVQAFMRMKKIKLSPSCLFVHQNVTDIAAAEKNMDGKRRLQEKLDNMAKLAAKEEGCDAEFFSDVIAFDVQKDVKYFAQLWEGSPPMAPPNPGYSESVQELKTIILSKAKECAGITLSEFRCKIQDLWKALMNEQFVFSFKNTLEVAVYRKLEVEYGNWTWKLRSNMLTIEIELHTKIQNRNCETVELTYLHQKLNKTYEEIQKEMTKYFDDDGDKDMLVQWRGRFEGKIKEFRDELVKGVKRKLDKIIQQKKACKKLDDKKAEFENNLLQKSKELAHKLKDKAKNEQELEKQFNSVWSDLVTQLTADTKPIEDINYDEDQSTVLQNVGFEWSLVNECKMSGKYKPISHAGDLGHYVSLTTKIKNVFMWSFQDEEQLLIKTLIDDVEKQTINQIKQRPVASTGYSLTYLQEAANTVKQKVTEFESKKKYALKKEFTVDLSLYIFHRAWTWISESHKEFKVNNDAHSYVDSKKMQYYRVFLNFCKGSSSAVVLGELICDKLKSAVVEAVSNKVAKDLTDTMKSNYPAFNGNRSDLEKHMLKSLAKKGDFNSFITYIQQPRDHTETYIREEVQNYISTKEGKETGMKILRKNLDDIKNLVSLDLYNATEKVKTSGGDPDMWMEEFSSLLQAKLTFNPICCKNFSDLNSFDFLKEEIENGLESIVKQLRSLSLDEMQESRMKPDQILIDQLCNCCWVKCPFCAAVCTNTLEDHSPDKHKVTFHRPAGITGIYWKGTKDLDINFCTTSVASDYSFIPSCDPKYSFPYKKYQTAGEKYASWEITPDESKLTYWKWFVCKFQKELEAHYNMKFQGRGEIPSAWKNHTEQEAVDSLDKL